MQKKDKDILERKLEEKLEQCAQQASQGQDCEEKLEALHYLMDKVRRRDQEEYPSRDEAWERFREIVSSQQELLPLAKAVLLPADAAEPERTAPISPDTGETESAALVSKEKADFPEAEKDTNIRSGREKKERYWRKVVSFGRRHKVAAAVFFAATLLALGSGVRTGAVEGSGFFFWLKEDDTGRQMMTSPEGLDGATNQEEHRYFDKDNLPEWAKDWVEIAETFEMPKNYEWQYFEASEVENMQCISSNFCSKDSEKAMVLGVWLYLDLISYNRDGYANYSFVQRYEMNQKEMDIYSKTEDTGDIFYIICFFEGNCQYFLRGQEDLEEMKDLAEKYRNCVEKNL